MAQHRASVRVDVDDAPEREAINRVRAVVRQEFALLGYHIEGLYGPHPDNSLESQYVPALRMLAKLLKEGRG